MQTSVNELDADEIQSQFKKLSATMNRMEIAFQGMRLKRQEKLATGKKDFLQKFQKKIPVIRALTTKGLKPEHIAKMAKKIGADPKTDITKQPLSMMENA